MKAQPFSFKTNEGFHNSIVKILLLYVGTSAIFLGIFLYLFYENRINSLRLQQMIQMRNEYVYLVDFITQNLISPTLEQDSSKTSVRELDMQSLSKLQGQISSPFALVDKNKNVLFSTLTQMPKNLDSILSHQKELHLLYENNQFFVNFRRIPLEKIFTLPPYNLPKRNEKTSKVFNNLGLSLILQGELIGSTIWQPSHFATKPLEENIQTNYIASELDKLRLQSALIFIFSLVAIGVVVYFLVKLSLRPVAEKFHTLNHFIKDSTHEINTPLSVILMGVAQLDKTKLDSKNLQTIRYIELGAQNLKSIYQNLIAFNFPLTNATKENLDLAKILKQRIEYFTPLITQKAIALQTEINPSFINANADNMKLLVDNLLSNAVKYTPRGGEIVIVLKKHFLSIKDSGCGIKEQNQKKIFERYTRFESHLGGFGIGLSLVKSVCELYGITITCQSGCNKGSEFILKWGESH